MTAVLQKYRRQMRVPGRKKNKHNELVAEQAKEKALQALELRKAGVTYEAIAKAIGFNNGSNVKRAIDRLLLRQQKDVSEDVIVMDLQRLDEYQQRCTNALRQNHDLSQIDRLLRIQEFRYRLLGIGDAQIQSLRDAYGVTTKIDNSTSVMIVQASQTSEEEFLKRMMQAVGIDADTNDDARTYIDARIATQPKAITSHTKAHKTTQSHTHINNNIHNDNVDNTKSKTTKQKNKTTKTKRIIVRKSASSIPKPVSYSTNKNVQANQPAQASPYIDLNESDVIDAEIVG